MPFTSSVLPRPGVSVSTHTTSSVPLEGTSAATTTTTSRITHANTNVTLEAIFQQCRSATDSMKTIDGRLKSLEERTTKLATSVKELNDLMKKHCKDSFTIKGTKFEVSKLIIVRRSSS